MARLVGASLWNCDIDQNEASCLFKLLARSERGREKGGVRGRRVKEGKCESERVKECERVSRASVRVSAEQMLTTQVVSSRKVPCCRTLRIVTKR